MILEPDFQVVLLRGDVLMSRFIGFHVFNYSSTNTRDRLFIEAVSKILFTLYINNLEIQSVGVYSSVDAYSLLKKRHIFAHVAIEIILINISTINISHLLDGEITFRLWDASAALVNETDDVIKFIEFIDFLH